MMKLFSIFTCLMILASVGHAQTAKKAKKKVASKKGTIKARVITPGFKPTCNLDTGSVGSYFFPANLGAKWTMRTIQQIFDGENNLVKSDTLFSFEEVVSDSNRSLQGLPVITCQSSLPFHFGEDLTAQTKEVEYYVDDSVVMAVTNHSVSNQLNRILLVNPLAVGNHWKDRQGDTLISRIIAVNEPVTVPVGAYPTSIVVRSSMKNSELSKFFVRGVGIVKMVFRGVPPTAQGTFVVTTELVKLDRGDETRSVKTRFASVR